MNPIVEEKLPLLKTRSQKGGIEEMRKVMTTLIAVAAVLLLANGCSNVGKTTYEGFNSVKAFKIADVPTVKGSLHFEKTLTPDEGGVVSGSFDVGDVHVTYTVNVPAGALNETEAVTIDIPDETEAKADLGPSPYTFNKPVTVTMSFENLPNVPDPDDIEVAWYDVNAGEWIVVPSTVTVDGNNMTVTYNTSHFTVWIIIDPDEP